MKKLNNKKGFTLAELLIVVAIIGVLTVVAVPIFTTQLEKAKENTDIANLREAKAAAASEYLTTSAEVTGKYFDAQSGKLVSSKPAVYGKGTETKGGCAPFAMSSTSTYTESTKAEGCAIKVEVSADGDITLTWD